MVSLHKISKINYTLTYSWDFEFKTNWITFQFDSQKPDDDDDDEEEEEEPTIVRHKTRNTDGSNKDKIETELLIEPKSEYEDGNDEAVEDLTMAEEDLMDDMEQAGPSHGGEGSSQGKRKKNYIWKRKLRKE